MQSNLFVEEEIRHIEVEKIKTNPFQPRREFALEDLEELAASIKTVGIIHPPIVRSLEEGEYELLAGERRLRASTLAGLKLIPVIIRNCEDTLSAEAALIENIQRVDLNPIEIAKALKGLADAFNLTQEEIAKKVGKKRSTIANYLRLLSLPSFIQESLYKNFITMGHAKAILSLPGTASQSVLHEKILKEDLSVRQAEEAANKIANREKKSAAAYVETPNLFLEDLARRMEGKLGTKVVISEEGGRGTISIDYYSLEDLERILSIFER